MKVNLGTIEVTAEERRIIAAHFGEQGLATRESIRRWVKKLVTGSIEDMGDPPEEEH